MALCIHLSDEPSAQHQAPTPAEGQEEATAKTPPEGDSEGGNPMVATGEEVEVIMTPSATAIPTELTPEEPEAATEGPAVDEKHFGRSDNSTVEFTPGEFDQPTGSGMLPPLSEEDGASPMAPVGEPEAAQPTTENEQQNETIEPEGDYGRTERKKSTSRNQSTRNCYKSKHRQLCVYDYSSLRNSGFGWNNAW